MRKPESGAVRSISPERRGNPAPTLRVCKSCLRELPLTPENFYFRRDSGKYRTDCKPCFRAAKNGRYERDPERARAIARKSYHRPEGGATKGLVTKRRNREAKPELYATILERYVTKHEARLRARRKELHAANREEQNRKSRAWYYANRDRALETALRWKERNPERARVLVEATRVKRLAAFSSLTTHEWREIWLRFGGRCAYCDAPATELEHVVPLARGGDHTAENVVPACKPCNRSKSAKWLDDWLREGDITASIAAMPARVGQGAD